jgi:hypothetical protein
VDTPTVYDAATIITMVTGVLIPILVAVLTRVHASPALKAVLNAGLSALSGVLSTLVIDDHTNWRHVVVKVLLTWALSIATYYGLWKPTTTTATVADATKGFGIGPSTDGDNLSAA